MPAQRALALFAEHAPRELNGSYVLSLCQTTAQLELVSRTFRLCHTIIVCQPTGPSDKLQPELAAGGAHWGPRAVAGHGSLQSCAKRGARREPV